MGVFSGNIHAASRSLICPNSTLATPPPYQQGKRPTLTTRGAEYNPLLITSVRGGGTRAPDAPLAAGTGTKRNLPVVDGR